MSRWLNLPELRAALERVIKLWAGANGLDNPSVRVTIEPTDKHGRRPIDVLVGLGPTGQPATTDDVATHHGREWEDN